MLPPIRFCCVLSLLFIVARSADMSQQMHVECKEPMGTGKNTRRWRCGISINEEEEVPEWRAEGAERPQGKMASAPLELYYSHKVNQSNGHLFISALARWQFRSSTAHPEYRVHLTIERESGIGENGTGRQRQVVIWLKPDESVGDEDGGHGVELLVRMDALFQFGEQYTLRIVCAAEDGEGDGVVALAEAVKHTQFDRLLDETDVRGCPGADGEPQDSNANNRTELIGRKAMAARWTGALRSVAFFPLHSAINVSFFGAPPSHCISSYRVQLWLLNTLQTEKRVQAGELEAKGTGVWLGNVEFRDLIRDERMKYRVKILPEELSNGTCVCELERKCGCVQVYSDAFSLLNASSPPPGASQSPSPSLPPSAADETSSFVQLLFAAVFLALTLLLLSTALLLLIVRSRTGRKRRTLLLFGKHPKDKEALVGSKKGTPSDHRREIHSVLLMNADPNRCHQLERFARVLVKNGIRVFYDRWESAQIESNLMQWAQQAAQKADKIVLFYDRHAEQLLSPCVGGKLQNCSARSSLYDRVFIALYQHLESHKTMFVKWDEQKLVDGRPLGVLSECVFLFQRDLKHIFTALKAPATDSDLREIEKEGRNGTGERNRESISSLAIVARLNKEIEVQEMGGLRRQRQAFEEGEGQTVVSGSGEGDEGLGTSITHTEQQQHCFEGGQKQEEGDSGVVL